MKKEILRIEDGRSDEASRFPLKGLHVRMLSGELNLILCENWDVKDTIGRVLAGEEGMQYGTVVLMDRNLSLQQERPVLLPQGEIVTMELNHPLNEYLSIAENLFTEDKTVFRTRSNERLLFEKAAALLRQFQMQIDLKTPVRNLSLPERIHLEMLRHYKNGVRMIVLDEPRRTLKDDEFDDLFRVIRLLQKKGMAFLILTTTDYLIQCYRILYDTIMIVSHGRTAHIFRAKEEDARRFFQIRAAEDLMKPQVGKTERKMQAAYFDCNIGFDNHPRISFCAARGMLYQLEFESRRKLLRFRQILCGERSDYEGVMWLDGQPYFPGSFLQAVRKRVCWINPNDFRGQLFEKLSVYDNIVLSRGWNFWGMKAAGKYREHIQTVYTGLFHETIDLDLQLKEVPADIQQKILYMKWYLMSPKVLLIENPFAFANVQLRGMTIEMIGRFLERNTTVLILCGEEDQLPELPSESFFF